MQVKKKLQVNVALSVLAACIVVPMLIVTAYRVGKAIEAQGIAGDIINGAFERVALRNDYVRNDSERARIQWFAKQEQLGRLLKSASQVFTDPEDRVLLADLARDHGSLFNLFSGIVENREKTASRAYSQALSQERENRLISQLNMKVYDTVLLARRLHESADSRMFSALRFFGWGVIAVISILSMAAIGNSLSMRRTIADRIERLRDGASIIGEGNLDHRIDITGDDEFADLAKAFNEMTEKLHGSHAALEKEVVERTEAEQALRQSEERLQFSLETSHIGAWDLDLVDHSAFRSLEHDRIFGYAQLLPKWTFEMFLEHVLPEDRQMVQARFQEAVATLGDWSFECRIRRADGEIRWIWAAGRHRVDETGRASRMAGIVQDITERKKAEELRLASAYHRSLLEASLDPLVTIDANGKVTDVNAATEKVTGQRREELIGTDFSDYFTERDKARAGYQQVFREGSVMDYALEIKRKDGHITPVLYNAAVYRDESGNVLGVFAAARDITERKQAEEKLKLANAYNRSLLEASLDPLVTIDAKGKITDVNVATEKVTGHSRGELIGTDFSDYFTDPEKARSGYQQVFREGSVTDYALEIKSKDGYITPVLYNAAVYRDESGSVTGVFAAARDITDRKKAEEEIRKLNRELEARVIERTAQLENSNRELEAFAYSVSHDLRSPLRSIEGFSLALLEDYEDKLDSTAKSYLSRVRNATMRMGHLIDDLLKLSRVTRSEMNRELVDLSIIGKDIAGRLAQSNPERPADFVIADGLAAYGDARLLTVALENLISNAWKFSEKAERSVIEFGTSHRDGARIFYVKDNGVGFDMSYAGKLFSPFQRLHKIEEFPGTGIGLATVKRIINRHGGQVWIESEVNKGTTVFFTL